MRRRSILPGIHSSLHMQIEDILAHDEILEDEDPRDLIGDNKLGKRTRCGYYPHSLD